MLPNTQLYVISLAHRSDRRESFTDALTSSENNLLAYQWLDAIYDVDFGGLGCAKSHAQALLTFISSSAADFVCILEDDFRFRLGNLELTRALKETVEVVGKWDVLLLAGYEVKGIPMAQISNRYTIYRVLESQTASGYITSRRYAVKLLELYCNSIAMMTELRNISPRALVYSLFAIDQVWKHLQKFDHWFCLNPMVGEQYPSFSDIEQRQVDYRAGSA